jgi:hypothetical protein
MKRFARRFTSAKNRCATSEVSSRSRFFVSFRQGCVT